MSYIKNYVKEDGLFIVGALNSLGVLYTLNNKE